MDELNNVMFKKNCHYYTYKGCSALDYTIASKDGSMWVDGKDNIKAVSDICSKCRFYKTQTQWDNMKNNKNNHSDIKGFYLIFDGINKGYFSSIIEIDKWLTNYFEQNKKDEYMPKNALFDDYNILFTNHNIRFLLKEDLINE